MVPTLMWLASSISIMFLRVFHAVGQISSLFFLLLNIIPLYDHATGYLSIVVLIVVWMICFVLFLCLFLPVVVKLL